MAQGGGVGREGLRSHLIRVSAMDADQMTEIILLTPWTYWNLIYYYCAMVFCKMCRQELLIFLHAYCIAEPVLHSTDETEV